MKGKCKVVDRKHGVNERKRRGDGNYDDDDEEDEEKVGEGRGETSWRRGEWRWFR